MSEALNPLIVLANKQGLVAGNPTFSAFLSGYTAYATPTDMVAIRGVAGKVISIRNFGLMCGATAATLVTFFWYRRAALNTGGTTTLIPPAKYDSRDAPAAAPFVYTTAPAITDAAAPLIGFSNNSMNANTAAKSPFLLLGQAVTNVVNVDIDLGKPLTVLENEELVLNFNGAALPAGFTSTAMLQWAESNV